MNTIQLTLTNIHPKGFAFGVSEETAEQCFIPPHVLDGIEANRGDSVTAQVVPNPNERQRENTRWCAINLMKVEHSVKPKAANEVLERKVYDYMSRVSHTYSEDIATAMAIEPAHAEEIAVRLFDQGRIAKADVYKNCDSKEPSYTLWAADHESFLECFEEEYA